MTVVVVILVVVVTISDITIEEGKKEKTGRGDGIISSQPLKLLGKRHTNYVMIDDEECRRMIKRMMKRRRTMMNDDEL
jgi:hypothetical protein